MTTTERRPDRKADRQLTEIRVLGPLEVVQEGRALTVGGPKQRTVLALLTAAAGNVVPLDSLVQGLYGDDAGSRVKRTIHTYVSNLRRELGDTVVRSGHGYRLDVEPSAVDAFQFEAVARDGMDLVDADPKKAGRILRNGLEMWRGHAYADVEARTRLDGEIVRLNELRVAVLESRIEADLAAGLHRELIGELEALTSEYPLREGLRAHHMLALYRSGRQSEALRAFGRTRTVLGEELGIDPSPRLQELEQQILVQDSTLDLRVRGALERCAVLAVEAVDDPLQSLAGVEDRLARRDALLDASTQAGNGRIIDLRGKAALAVFPTVGEAIRAARSVSDGESRIAIDFGQVEVSTDRHSGPPINRALRLAAVSNAGQTLVSSEAHLQLTASGEAGWSASALGRFDIRGLGEPVVLFQVTPRGGPDTFGPLLVDRLPPPLAEPTSAALVPGYEIREELGRDEAGIVSRAYQSSIGREVVLRSFHPAFVSDQHFIRRFELVLQSVARLEHPHLVPIIDYWRDPERAIVVYSLIDGQPLTPTTRPTSAAGAASIIEHVGNALSAAHRRHIAHGRLDPAHIVVDDNGNPYLRDLGIAVIIHGIKHTETTAFTSPEFPTEGPTTATDVYSFGKLIEWLSDDVGLTPLVAGATARNPDQRPSLEETVQTALTSLVPNHALGPRTDVRNPYKGLVPFQEGDAADFFGRGKLVDELVLSVAARRFTLVAGPSGVGKSSVVRAGVLPALRSGALPGSDRWLITTMFPGGTPFRALHEALQRIAVSPTANAVEQMKAGEQGLVPTLANTLPEGAEILLVIDQFEELFTHVTDVRIRRRFIELIAEADADLESPIRIVATMRADFLDRPLQYSGFGSIVSDALVTVAAPDCDELAEIIEAPAAAVGIAVDPALVELLTADAHDETGALPLLEHTLFELFEAREADKLTSEAYRAGGGIQEAIRRRADQIYESMSLEDRGFTRDLFIRLVTVDEESEDTRRRVRRAELAGIADPVALDRILEAFGRQRLLVFDRDTATRGPTVEVAHESLIASWDRLKRWVDEVRDDLLTGRRAELATREWVESGRDPSYLMSGARLEQAEAWRDSTDVGLTSDEERFVEDSRASADASREKRSRNRRRLLAGLSGLTALALAFGVVAWTQRGIAQRRSTESRVQELVAESYAAMEEDPNLAINLALAAHDQARALPDMPGEVTAALQATTQDSRLLAILPYGLAGSTWSNGGSLLAVTTADAPDRIVLLDTTDWTAVTEIRAAAPVGWMSFSPDDERLAVGYWDHLNERSPENAAELPAGQVFGVESGEELAMLPGRCCGFNGGFSPDGGHLAAMRFDEDGNRSTLVWDVDQVEPTLFHEFTQQFMAWWGDHLVNLGGESSEIFDGTTSELVVAAPDGEIRSRLPSPSEFVNHIAVDPDRQRLSVTSQVDRATYLLDENGTLTRTFYGSASLGSDFTPDGNRLIRYGNDARVEMIDLESGSEVFLYGQGGGVPTAHLSPDGSRLATTSWDGTTRIWSIEPTGPESLGAVNTSGMVVSMEESADGSRLGASMVEAGVGRARVFDLTDGSVVSSSDLVAAPWAFPHVSVAGYAAGMNADESGRVEDLDTGAVVLTVDDDCGFPVAIDDRGAWTLIGGGGYCEVGDRRGRAIDIASGTELFELDYLPVAAAIGPSGTPAEGLVAINRNFEAVELRRISDGEMIGSIQLDELPFAPRFSADGRFVSWGGQLGRVMAVDVDSVLGGEPMATAIVADHSVEGGPAHVVNVGSGLLASSHSGEFVNLWDLQTGDLVVSMPVGSQTPINLAFTRDERYLLYTDASGTIRRMPLEVDELVALAEQRTLRPFSPAECERFVSRELDCESLE